MIQQNNILTISDCEGQVIMFGLPQLNSNFQHNVLRPTCFSDNLHIVISLACRNNDNSVPTTRKTLDETSVHFTEALEASATPMIALNRTILV